MFLANICKEICLMQMATCHREQLVFLKSIARAAGRAANTRSSKQTEFLFTGRVR